MDPAVELFKCEPCNRVFGTIKSFKQHYVMSPRHNNVDIKCGLCSVTFKRKSNLTKHYHDKHHDLVGNGVNYAENQLKEMSIKTAPPAEQIDYAQASNNMDVARLDDQHMSEYKYYLQATPSSNVFELYVKMAYDNPVVYDFEWRQMTDYPSPCCLDGLCPHRVIEEIGNLVTKFKIPENLNDPSIGSTILWLIVEARNEGIIIENPFI